MDISLFLFTLSPTSREKNRRGMETRQLCPMGRGGEAQIYADRTSKTRRGRGKHTSSSHDKWRTGRMSESMTCKIAIYATDTRKHHRGAGFSCSRKTLLQVFVQLPTFCQKKYKGSTNEWTGSRRLGSTPTSRAHAVVVGGVFRLCGCLA